MVGFVSFKVARNDIDSRVLNGKSVRILKVNLHILWYGSHILWAILRSIMAEHLLACNKLQELGVAAT